MTKLDDKSMKCVHFRLSEGTKAYILYNPVIEKIVISRDVVFEKTKSWDWNNVKPNRTRIVPK